MRDEDGEKKRVGLMAGSTYKGAYRNPAAENSPLVIGDKIPVIRAIEGKGGRGGAAGRTGTE